MSRGSSDYSRSDRDSDWNERNRGYSRTENRSNSNDDRNWWDKTRDEISSWFGDDEAERRRRRDEMRENYRGRGPKGYTRSDERIREDVNDRLTDDQHIDASGIEVTVNNCEVTLSGHVSSRWAKRHAEDIVESVSGVKNVENRLKTTSGSSDTDYNSSTGTSTGTSSTGTSRNSSVPPVGAYEQSKS
jgi:osmotically-inducible protein OsmY